MKILQSGKFELKGTGIVSIVDSIWFSIICLTVPVPSKKFLPKGSKLRSKKK